MPACPVSATVALSAHGDVPAASESWSTRIPITRAPIRRKESMAEGYGAKPVSAVSEWDVLLWGKC